MARSQQTKRREPPRGVLARPLEALVFLLPFLIVYEVVSRIGGQRVIANDLIQMFFDLFGPVGTLAPALAVVAILLATHVASGERWRIRPKRVLMMYAEAVLLSVPLLVLIRTFPLGMESEHGWLQEVALSVGAGVYEELVFRLVAISLIMMVGVDLLRLSPASVALAAMVLSSLAFAAHHHPPLGHEQFASARFAFRSLAGGYLAIVFWYRGYGPAAGCHAAYNIATVIVRRLSTV